MANARPRSWIASMGRWFRRQPATSTLPAPQAQPAVSAPPVDARIGVMLEEWREIRVSQRELASGRFARLALYSAVSAALIAGYLPLAVSHDPAAALGRWVLPALGIVASIAALAMEWGSAAEGSELAHRGRQLEGCMHLLMPGVGPVRSPGLLSGTALDSDDWLRSGLAAACALYCVLLLAWAAALASTAVGWPAA